MSLRGCRGCLRRRTSRLRREAADGDPDKLVQDVSLSELGGLKLADYGALLNEKDPLRKLGDELKILLDEDDGQSLRLVKVLQDNDELLDDRRLNPLGGLVEEDELGIARQAPGDGQQLLLPAAEGGTATVQQRRQPRKCPENRVNPFLGASAREPHAQVVANAESGEDLSPLRNIAKSPPCSHVRGFVGDVRPVEDDAAAPRGYKPHERLEKRRLAHSIVPEDTDKLP